MQKKILILTTDARRFSGLETVLGNQYWIRYVDESSHTVPYIGWGQRPDLMMIDCNQQAEASMLPLLEKLTGEDGTETPLIIVSDTETKGMRLQQIWEGYSECFDQSVDIYTLADTIDSILAMPVISRIL